MQRTCKCTPHPLIRIPHVAIGAGSVVRSVMGPRVRFFVGFVVPIFVVGFLLGYFLGSFVGCFLGAFVGGLVGWYRYSMEEKEGNDEGKYEGCEVGIVVVGGNDAASIERSKDSGMVDIDMPGVAVEGRVSVGDARKADPQPRKSDQCCQKS